MARASVKKTATNNFGNKAGPGRPKGVPNKLTMAVKDMVEKALRDKGGAEYLARQADDNPTAFLALVGKLLPLDVKSTNHTTIEVLTKEQRDAAVAAAKLRLVS